MAMRSKQTTHRGHERNTPLNDMEGRLLGIDYGKRRIGLAISDPLGMGAYPLPPITLAKGEDPVTAVLAVAEEKEAARIVVGLPLNMNGSEGFMAEEVRRFVEELRKRFAGEVATFDERLTSMEAERTLRSADLRGMRKKAKKDSLSAQIILQTYMDSRAP